MTSGFRTDPQALETASHAFDAQVQPINALATDAEQVSAGPATTGRDYAAEGSAYHAAMLTFVQTLMTPLATKTTWVGDTLAASAGSYRQQDTAASGGITSAGRGA